MFFDEARQRGCRSVRAITSPLNTGSVGFHTSMGFEVMEGDRTQDGVSIHSDYDGGHGGVPDGHGAPDGPLGVLLIPPEFVLGGVASFGVLYALKRRRG